MAHKSYVQSVNRVDSVLATNQVIRNTYILLSLTLLFSAATAWFAMVTHAAPMGLFTMILYFGLLYLTNRYKDTGMGIVCVFALTGTLGYTLGPILSMYMTHLHNGSQIVMTAMGGTGLIFLALSGYTLTSRKDFSFMGGMMMAGFMVVFLASIAAIFLRMPA
ncbi:MAG: Bax inhibitor-1 family protein, partial [Pseudomonadota bacterium]